MNKLMEHVVHLCLCPGDYQANCETCKTCPSSGVQNCRSNLKKSTHKLYLAGLNKVEDAKPFSLKVRITQALKEIGVPAHVKGYEYLRYALELTCVEREYLEDITKRLYPDIAKRFGTTDSRVERAIRHAVEIAWDRGDLDTLKAWFGWTVSSTKGKPTNSEFIARISDSIRLEMAEQKEREEY